MSDSNRREISPLAYKASAINRYANPEFISIQFKKKWSLRKMEGSNLIQLSPNISLSRRILSPFRIIFHWRDLGDSNPDLHSDSVLCKPLHHRPRKSGRVRCRSPYLEGTSSFQDCVTGRCDYSSVLKQHFKEPIKKPPF